MAQGYNAKKRGNRGKEWWGKRPYRHLSVRQKGGAMKKWKRFLHKAERGQSKRIIRNEINQQIR